MSFCLEELCPVTNANHPVRLRQGTSMMQASYDSLVQAQKGASNDFVQVINSILAKFFPHKFPNTGKVCPFMAH